MSAACPVCIDTGSRTQQLWGYLDCTHCDVATERTLFEHWVVQHAPNCTDLNDAWLIYRLGQKSVMEKK